MGEGDNKPLDQQQIRTKDTGTEVANTAQLQKDAAKMSKPEAGHGLFGHMMHGAEGAVSKVQDQVHKVKDASLNPNDVAMSAFEGPKMEDLSGRGQDLAKAIESNNPDAIQHAINKYFSGEGSVQGSPEQRDLELEKMQQLLQHMQPPPDFHLHKSLSGHYDGIETPGKTMGYNWPNVYTFNQVE